ARPDPPPAPPGVEPKAPAPAAAPASDRWPALAAAAEHALARWRPEELRRALHAVRDYRRRHPGAHPAADQTATRLSRALAFRSRVTAGGLALALAGRVESV